MSQRADYERIVRVLLQSLRAKATQKEMSARVGYSFNQWHKWESGQKTLLWSELKKIARALDLDIDTHMQAIGGSGVSLAGSGGNFVKHILDRHGGGPTIRKKLGVSQTTLYRSLTSKSNVSVAFVFQCIGELTSLLPYFLTAFTKNFTDVKFDTRVRKSVEQPSIEADYPWLSAIEAFLETTHYRNARKHSDALIADQLGLSLSGVKTGLKILLENEMINFVDGKYGLNARRIDFLNASDSARFARYWNEVAIERFSTPNSIPSSGRGWASRVVPLSEEAHFAIIQLRQKFYNDLSRILQEDGGTEKTRVTVMVDHSFDHTEFKKIKKQTGTASPTTILP